MGLMEGTVKTERMGHQEHMVRQERKVTQVK